MISGLLTVEIFLRLTEISLPSYVYDDPKLGRTFRPNAKIFRADAEGFCISQVNKYGYLGKPYDREKNRDSLRICLVGDSFVEGMQVFDRNHFRTILENELKQGLNRNVEVLNFGIGGIDFRVMYFIYSQRILEFNPDIVLFFVKDDDFLSADVLPAPEIIVRDNELAIDYSFLNNAESKLRRTFKIVRNFSLGNLSKEAFEQFYLGRFWKIVLDKMNFLLAKGQKQEPIHQPQDRENDRYFGVNTKIIRQLDIDANKHGTRNIIIKVNSWPSYYSDILSREKIMVFDLESELAHYINDEIYFKAFEEFGHWNYFGHRIVADYLAKSILLLYDQDKNCQKE